MPRPRRPALAAACSILLLATTALWVRGYWRWDAVIWYSAAAYERKVTAGRGAAWLWIGSVTIPWGNQGGVHFISEPAENLVTSPTHPWWPHVRHEPGWGTSLSAPMWLVALPPTFGLWWSYRGRKAGAGFPVEAMEDAATK